MNDASELRTAGLPEGESVAHHFGGKVYIKETRINAGRILVQHKHEYEHLSYLVSGTVELEVDGTRSEVNGPAALTIAAAKHHGLKALTDTVWLCIHSTDCTDAQHVDETLVIDGNPEEIASILGGMQ